MQLHIKQLLGIKLRYNYETKKQIIVYCTSFLMIQNMIKFRDFLISRLKCENFKFDFLKNLYF